MWVSEGENESERVMGECGDGDDCGDYSDDGAANAGCDNADVDGADW